ncbi:hypothetical protein [[Pseudopropionibacterium] massiliense]|uniref:hypothetical protein n=1 Tax=[Pseudopropionibacterium] massiliense TaxID=2220000 RepID=UPI00102FC30E|nr:hypothetical protein [[Pseudopropionibacterium] massiliense]
MGEPVSVLRRIGNWFGLTGTYEPKAGEVRPLWYNVSKSKYLAISIPIWVAGIALFFLLLQGGIHWALASIVSVQSITLAMLIAERSTIKINHG